jgi:hypothetical protein
MNHDALAVENFAIEWQSHSQYTDYGILIYVRLDRSQELGYVAVVSFKVPDRYS